MSNDRSARPMTKNEGRIQLSSFVFRRSSFVVLIVAAYLVIGTLYAVKTPAWQVPDEPAHYNYVRYIVEHRALPVLRPGDYDQKYIEQFATPENTSSSVHRPTALRVLAAAAVLCPRCADLPCYERFAAGLATFLCCARWVTHRRRIPDRSSNRAWLPDPGARRRRVRRVCPPACGDDGGGAK